MSDPLQPDWQALLDIAAEPEDQDISESARRLEVGLSRDPGLRRSREERKRQRDEARRSWQTEA